MHDACPPMLNWFENLCIQGPKWWRTRYTIKRKSRFLLILWRLSDYFFSPRDGVREKKSLVYNLKTSLFLIHRAREDLKSQLLSLSLVAPAPQHNADSLSLPLGDLLYQGSCAKACCVGRHSLSGITMTYISLFKHGLTFCYSLSPKHCSVGRVMDTVESVFLSPRLQYFQPDTDILALHQEIQLWGHYVCILA